MKVSIIVPCFNQAHFLEEALESVLAQSYQDWECIIVNDGSTDATETLAGEWVKKDPRFLCIHQNNSGVVVARNNGILHSSGIYILPLDADDKISIDYTAKAIQKFSENKKLKAVYCEAELFGSKTGLWKLLDFSLKNLAQKNMIFTSAFYRKKDWENVGGYDINMTMGLEDWEFWINLLKGGGDVYKIPEVGFYYRQVEKSRNASITKEQYEKLYEYLSLKHPRFFIKQLGSFKHLNEKILKLEKQNIKLQNKLDKKEGLYSFLLKVKRKIYGEGLS